MPITAYGQFDGLNLPVRIMAVWTLADGDQEDRHHHHGSTTMPNQHCLSLRSVPRLNQVIVTRHCLDVWGLLDPRRRMLVTGSRSFATVANGFRWPDVAQRVWWVEVRPTRIWFQDSGVLLELLRADKIHPVVTEHLPLSEARHAHELLETSAAKGRLVLIP